MTEGQVDPHEGLALLLGEVAVGEDVPGQVGVAVGPLEDARLDVEGLGRDAQRLGDLLEDLRRRAAQAPFDLAQVGVGDPGQLGQAPQRQPRRAPLLADERSQLVEALRQLLDEPVAVVADRLGHDRRPSTEAGPTCAGRPARPGACRSGRAVPGARPTPGPRGHAGDRPGRASSASSSPVSRATSSAPRMASSSVVSSAMSSVSGEWSTGVATGTRRPGRARPGCRPGSRPGSRGRGRPTLGPFHVGVDDVQAALDQSPQVGERRLGLLALGAHPTDVVERQAADVVEVVGSRSRSRSSWRWASGAIVLRGSGQRARSVPAGP